MICKKRKCIWIFVICIFILSGCSNLSYTKDLNYLEQSENTENAVNIEDIEISQLQKDMSFLTSDQCEGRRPGTLGNELAGEYIAGRLNEIGLQPLEEDYRIPYTKQMVSLVSDDITLEILDGDTRIDEFIYGRDFIEVFLNNADFSLPLVLSPLDGDCVVLIDDASKNDELSKNPSVKLIIQKSEKLSRQGGFYHDGFTPRLKVLPEAYNMLLEYTGKNVRFIAEIEEKAEVQKNIAGVIKGQDNSNVLLVSAHFDHVGKIGDVIWRGALDNASGVCTILKTAEVLSEHYKDSRPPYDIVFCAFNSEETLSSWDGGSIYFSSYLYEKYLGVLNINLDCLGNKDEDGLLIQYNDSEASEGLADIIAEALQKADIKTELIKEGPYMSDHRSFHDALCISTIKDIATSNIHTTDDTQEMIDMEYLETMGYQLGEIVINRIDDLEFSRKANSGAQTDSNPANSKTNKVRVEDLTVKEFEEAYHCELDFIDSDSIKINVISSNRSILNEPLNTKEYSEQQMTNQEDMTLWDVRHLNFVLGYLDVISFHTYDKSNSFEMMAYELDNENNGFTKEDLTYLFTDGGGDYYITNKEEKSDNLLMIKENDSFIVRILLRLNVNSDALLEDYKKYYQDNIKTEYIDGMVKLLLEVEEKQDE